MSRKTLTWGGMIVGSAIGGMLPYLWGNFNAFSFSSIFLGSLGGLIGIWAGWNIYRIGY